MIVDSLSWGTPLDVAGLLFIVWIGQKFIDTLVSFAIDRRVFQPVYERILRKIKIFRTRADPVAAQFSLSFTPRDPITVSEAVERLKRSFDKIEQISSNKVSVSSQSWTPTDREGSLVLFYSDRTEKFNIQVDITPDPQSIRNHPSGNADDLLVGSIGLEVEFDFPFHLLEHTLFNVGSLISYVEDGIEDEMRGTFSSGRFVVAPVHTNLTLDEWIQKEKFDVSLLLASEDDRTEVEFFGDRAIVKSNGREIDAKTVKYVRELLLNYYL